MNSQERLGPEWEDFFRKTDKKGMLPWATVASIWNARTGESLSEVQVNAMGQRAATKVRMAIRRDPVLRAAAVSMGLQP